MKVTLETLDVAGIPVLCLSPHGARKRPLVIYLHTLNGSKEEALELGCRFAAEGMVFAAFDAWMHGERYDPRREEVLQPEHQFYPDATRLDEYVLTLQISAQSARDTAALLGHFGGDARVDRERAAVLGVSMGAFAAFQAAARVPGIQAAVAALGHPALAESWENLILEVASQAEWSEQVERARPHTAEVAAWMRSIDPVERIRSFAPRPLLMLNGDVDPFVPKIYSVRLFHALRPLYAARPEALRLRILDGVGHAFSPGMQTAALDWIRQALKPA